MNINEFFNNITRFIIYISILLFLYSQKTIYLVLCFISLIIIFLTYHSKFKYSIQKYINNSNTDTIFRNINKINKNSSIPKQNFIKKIKNNIQKRNTQKIFNDISNSFGNMNYSRNSYRIINDKGDEQEKLAKWLYCK